MGIPCRTRGRIERSSVSFLKSSVPLIEASISLVSNGDRAVDLRNAARERQADHRALQLGGRIDLAERIDGFGQAIERQRGVELRVHERRRTRRPPARGR